MARMNAVQITELKEFFITTLDDALEPIRADIRQLKDEVRQLKDDVGQLKVSMKQIKTDLESHRQETADGFAAVGDALERLFLQDEQRVDLLTQFANKWKKS